MQTQLSEIAAGVYRLSTWTPDVAPPAGFTFNQFLIDGEEPMLFHCGQRQLFPLVAEAVARILPLERLRWISFGHVEADECGAMNQWLAAAPQACAVAQDISTPLAVLEAEHEQAGDLMQAIRTITDGYTPPAGACTTFRVTMEELKEFEEDLHRHVHLENNVLFPRVQRPPVNACAIG